MKQCSVLDENDSTAYYRLKHLWNGYGECVRCGGEALKPFTLKTIQVCPKCDKVDVAKGHGCFEMRGGN